MIQLAMQTGQSLATPGMRLASILPCILMVSSCYNSSKGAKSDENRNPGVRLTVLLAFDIIYRNLSTQGLSALLDLELRGSHCLVLDDPFGLG